MGDFSCRLKAEGLGSSEAGIPGWHEIAILLRGETEPIAAWTKRVSFKRIALRYRRGGYAPANPETILHFTLERVHEMSIGAAKP